MPREESNSPGAKALRAAGFVKLPAFWVTQEQMELVVYMASQNKPQIDQIKDQAYDIGFPNLHRS